MLEIEFFRQDPNDDGTTPLRQHAEDVVLDAVGVGAKVPARGSAPAAEQEEQEQESLGDAGLGFDDLPSRTCVHLF